jgi:lipopolysaccharide biosynthesis regulator YciM
MSAELLVAVLAVAMTAAWWVGRRGARKSPQGDEVLPARYLQGLNYLLNEQPDKAIEVFIKLIEVDGDTVETHFALGNLFRRRGEVDRAIRIHQNLIARQTLNKTQRTQALYELGLDYTRAGIFSRAESVFEELVDDEAQAVAALKQLVEIYQQEREWPEAINALEKLEQVSGKKRSATIAQYHCELAELALQQNETARAREHVTIALRNDSACVRASLLEASLERSANRPRNVLHALKRVEAQDPDFIAEILHPLVQAYETLDQGKEALDYLRRLYEKFDGISVLLVLVDLLREHEGDAAAAAFLSEQLRRRPSVQGMNRLIELDLSRGSAEARENLLLLKELTSNLLANKPAYKCRHCGFHAKALHWQCPGCKTWNSLKPVEGVEGE